MIKRSEILTKVYRHKDRYITEPHIQYISQIKSVIIASKVYCVIGKWLIL